MVSNFSYRFTEKAAQDLDEILNYISFTLCNPSAAKDFYDKLSDFINQAISFPEAGAPVNNPSVALPNVRKLFIKNYTLYYVPDLEGKTIILLRIVYSYRDLDEIIRTLND